MFETRQSLPRARGRSLLALSTLALLALCCLPALALGAASAGYEYTDAPSSATGGGSSPSKSNLSGGSGSTSGIGSPADSGSGNGSKGAKSSGSGDSSSQSGAGQKDGTGSQGSQGKGGDSAVAGGKPVSSEPGSDGGSSPLVPILIAILVLAGASVAYVVIKRRRAGDADSADSPGSSVSPEAS